VFVCVSVVFLVFHPSQYVSVYVNTVSVCMYMHMYVGMCVCMYACMYGSSSPVWPRVEVDQSLLPVYTWINPVWSTSGCGLFRFSLPLYVCVWTSIDAYTSPDRLRVCLGLVPVWSICMCELLHLLPCICMHEQALNKHRKLTHSQNVFGYALPWSQSFQYGAEVWGCVMWFCPILLYLCVWVVYMGICIFVSVHEYIHVFPVWCWSMRW
jgi:hypothetical protein